MVTLGSGANREVDDYILTRYACYLIAENGDLRKGQIAFAQSYFAVQTRKQELIEEKDLQGEADIFCVYGKSYIGFLHNILASICVRIPGSYLASKYFPDTLFLINEKNEKNMQYTAKTTARKHLQTVQRCGIVSILHFYTNILDKGTDRGVSVQIEVMRSGKENVRDN